MAFILAIFEVEDYDKWRQIYDANVDFRRDSGQTGEARVFQDCDNPGKISILFGWDSEENAKAFASSDDLKQKMKEAGVTGQPQVNIVNEK